MCLFGMGGGGECRPEVRCHLSCPTHGASCSRARVNEEVGRDRRGEASSLTATAQPDPRRLRPRWQGYRLRGLFGTGVVTTDPTEFVAGRYVGCETKRFMKTKALPRATLRVPLASAVTGKASRT